MTALSTTGVSRPFDVDRDGFVMGEGAAVLVLEEWEHAVGARGARSSARSSARRATPTPTTSRRRRRVAPGAAACMRLALDDAGLAAGRHRPDQRPRHVDAAERRRRGRGRARPCSATTARRSRRSRASPVTPLGAAGALEAAAVLLSFEHRLIPPTANTKVVDLGIDVVTGDARDWEPGPTISNNFGFGGHNGSVILAPA